MKITSLRKLCSPDTLKFALNQGALLNLGIGAAMFLLSQTTFANTEKYCSTIAEMAQDYVSDRDARQSYSETLSTIDIAILEVKSKGSFTNQELAQWKRDLYASAKIAYKDYPKITRIGIYKLVKLGCISE